MPIDKREQEILDKHLAQIIEYIALVGNEGNDILLDRIIATREPNRKIGDKLCFPKPYERLLKAIDASPPQQANLLLNFVDK